jgi:hypothetical protein
MDDKTSKPNSEAEVSPAKPPVDIHDEAAVLIASDEVSPKAIIPATYAELRKEYEDKCVRLEMSELRVVELERILASDDKTEIRHIVLSLAYEYAVHYDLLRKREREKTRERERPRTIKAKLWNLAIDSAVRVLTPEETKDYIIDYREENGRRFREFSLKDGTFKITIALPPPEEEIAAVQKHYDRLDSEFSNYYRHKDEFLKQAVRNNPVTEDEPDHMDVLPDGLEFFDEQTKIEILKKKKLTECYHKAELAEIKETVMAAFSAVKAEVQGLRYYLHRYEKMGPSDIVRWYKKEFPDKKPPTKQTVEQTKSKAVAFATDNNLAMLTASPELTAWYDRCMADLTFYTLPDGTDPIVLLAAEDNPEGVDETRGLTVSGQERL